MTPNVLASNRLSIMTGHSAIGGYYEWPCYPGELRHAYCGPLSILYQGDGFSQHQRQLLHDLSSVCIGQKRRFQFGHRSTRCIMDFNSPTIGSLYELDNILNLGMRSGWIE